MRSATGLMAGPESPAVRLEMRGSRLSISIAMPTNVLTSERASAPADSAARASTVMSVTLGESFTKSGRLAARFAAPTTSSVSVGSFPYTIPPQRVFGQEMFSS